MEISASSVEKGMDVVSADGKQLGSVAEVWADSDSHGTVERSTTELADFGPISGTSSVLDTTSGYFRVTDGGIGGVGEKSMYIPLNEVISADRDSGVHLSCSADLCHERYEDTPESFRTSQ
jgi:hypothetical protein